jgi:site-specific DNA-methyltransferase (adenine-specific)
MFPEELPRRLIKMFSFVGENILDPFGGSGTTSLAAKNLQRNSILIEINEEFQPVIKEKLQVIQSDIYGTTYEFLHNQSSTNFSERIKELPYIFKDPLKFDKKIDVKKLQFGSRIDKNSAVTREEYFSIMEVLSPERVRLNNDLVIKLLGVKTLPENCDEACKFLKEKTKGKKVFLRYDKIKFDKEDNLLCYLYLENKTFLNAHLIKNYLVDVDTSFDYQYRSKFIKLQSEPQSGYGLLGS